MCASTCAYSAPLPSICGHGQSLPCLWLGLLWLRRSTVTGPTLRLTRLTLCLTRLRRTRLLTAIRLARLLATALLLLFQLTLPLAPVTVKV